MISFFQASDDLFFVVESRSEFPPEAIQKLVWLFGNAHPSTDYSLRGTFIGPRKEMITPWSTNAVEITQNMGIEGIVRIEQFKRVDENSSFDAMLEMKYDGIGQEIFKIDVEPAPIEYVEDLNAYNTTEGLALSQEEIEYLQNVSKELNRPLTDSEVFGFSQVNSEHCRHKIFNGQFIIDDVEMPASLFQLIRKTSSENPNRLVSAYKDNVAFIEGPKIEQFAPKTQHQADFFETREIDSVISIKAETHNFPTTVEPFNGAATGSGGEIRDRMAGGNASMPLAGTAVYMTSYPRLNGGRSWENNTQERPWLYQTPLEILIKASNGASDYGNKFGQPLIAGSVLTFEHEEEDKTFGFDKVVMLAGGIGYGKTEDSQKGHPEPGDKIVVLGGDNYRIGMGGSAVSSVATGEYANAIELNAVQRSNPEMQKRVYNAIRAMSESNQNPIVSIHDHGAGGHLNCLSELVEESGGTINIDALPVGDPTLSAKEKIGNESQERMGLIIKESDLDKIDKVAKRERAPLYIVGDVTGDRNFQFSNGKSSPVDLKIDHLLGSSPKTVLYDKTQKSNFNGVKTNGSNILEELKKLLQIEAVACKDWLTNKVDRSVTGRVAMQQCAGELQLPLNNVGIMALDYRGVKGVATAIGHSPVSALIEPESGSQLSIAEALTNIVWAPLEGGLKGVSLSANWMWPAKNTGENTRLYSAVKAASDFAIDLGINIPTGKDSLSMTQKYPDGKVVYSPGTVIISAAAEVSDINKAVSPVALVNEETKLYYVNLTRDDFHLGGSSYSQIQGVVGSSTPNIKDADHFSAAFDNIQKLIESQKIVAGHDISSGGLITSLLEVCFPSNEVGLELDLSKIDAPDLMHLLFSENPAVLIQTDEGSAISMLEAGIDIIEIGKVVRSKTVTLKWRGQTEQIPVDQMRDLWFSTSFLLDQEQSGKQHANLRRENYKHQPLVYRFPESFSKNHSRILEVADRPKAGIIREKGVNGDREMAYAMYLAGFDVKDIHMTDLVSGREDLSDVNFIVFVGGFSNSDVLGSAKGWAGAFLYNEKAKRALDNFYARNDTISLGVCNGCQLMMELELLYPDMDSHPKMDHNGSGKFESNFITVEIPENESVMLSSLSGTRLGVWVAHGEGRFRMSGSEENYNILGKYGYDSYPANPNDSDFNTAILASNDGRHLAMMPHLERSVFSWNWPWIPDNQNFNTSPWLEAFLSAYRWVADLN